MNHFGLVLRVLDSRTKYPEVLCLIPGAVLSIAKKYCDAMQLLPSIV